MNGKPQIKCEINIKCLINDTFGILSNVVDSFFQHFKSSCPALFVSLVHEDKLNDPANEPKQRESLNFLSNDKASRSAVDMVESINVRDMVADHDSLWVFAEVVKSLQVLQFGLGCLVRDPVEAHDEHAESGGPLDDLREH